MNTRINLIAGEFVKFFETQHKAFHKAIVLIYKKKKTNKKNQKHVSELGFILLVFVVFTPQHCFYCCDKSNSFSFLL